MVLFGVIPDGAQGVWCAKGGGGYDDQISVILVSSLFPLPCFLEL